jgi:hypothetical protein
MPEPARTLAESFRYYAERVFSNSSPLYAHLSAAAADDAELMRVLRPYTERRIFPTLLMAAIHDTLMATPDHPLRQYFASLTPKPLKPFGAYPAMRDLFYAEHEYIASVLQTRIVQTNEVRRCTSLLPTFARIQKQTGRPLALIEIGSSMGLLLNWHRYRYDYGDGRIVEPHADDTPLTLTTASRDRRVPLPDTMPPVQRVVGLDINPLGVDNADDVRWVQALIWPEHHARRERLQAALETARQHPPTLYTGDARDIMPRLLAELDAASATPVVFHSNALVQLDRTEREKVFAPLRDFSQQEDIYRVQLEWYRGMQYPEVWRFRYRKGRQRRNKEAETEPHGAWLRWWARR